MEDNAPGGDFLEELVAEFEAALDFGGRADKEVEGERAGTGEADFGCEGGARALVGHNEEEIDVGIFGGSAVGVGAEEDDARGMEALDDVADE